MNEILQNLKKKRRIFFLLLILIKYSAIVILYSLTIHIKSLFGQGDTSNFNGEFLYETKILCII